MFPDQDVIARAVRRDPEAFTELYELCAVRVYRHISYLVGNSHEADDLTSEAFLRAWKAIHTYEDRGLPIANWFLRIGHNLAARHLKRRRPRISVDDVRLEADSRNSPEVMAEATLDSETVRRAILRLPSVQRQVIVWRFLENMSYEEVEGILGKSQGAIRVIQHRALKKLRSILESSFAGESSPPRAGPAFPFGREASAREFAVVKGR